MTQKHALGWKTDHYDPLDLKLTLPAHFLQTTAVTNFSLLSEMPANYDQLDLGSCTANSGGSIFEHALRKLGLAEFTPSRLAVYYQTRKLEGTTRRDDGAQLRDVFKVLGKLGAAPEALWPYDTAKFAKAPPAAYTKVALKHVATKYLSVAQTLQDLKGALLAGYPVSFGFTCYPALESEAVAKTGLLPMPEHGEQPIGGHAVVLIGFDETRQLFQVRNSWGSSWGVDGGQFWMPYAYVINPKLSSDFWVVEVVSG